VNLLPLIDDTDFKTRETAITYDQAGMDLVWNFVTSAGTYTQTAVTPTTGGDYDWAHQGDGMYSIEIPASGGVSINNDTEGYGWFTGFCTGVLPWRGPVIGFRASGLNDLLCDNAYSVTRGLTGTAVPAAVADAAGGLPISDAGGLDLDIALQKGMFAFGSVWVDSAGTNSTAWPYGTAPYPTTTIANGKVIADANGVTQLRVKGAHTLAAAMEGYNFVGGLYIDTTEGASGNAALINDATTFIDCYLYALTNLNGWAYGGRMEGACSIRDLGYATLHNVLFGSGLACTLTLQAPAVCDIENMSGELTLAGMDGGVCTVSMSRGSILTIDNTCTAGTITVTGAGTVTDNSGVGCTVTVQVAEADVVQVSGDATAADNLETMLDGTGGQTLSLGRLVVSCNNLNPAVSIQNTLGNGASITSTAATGMSIGSTGGNNIGLSVAGAGSGTGMRIAGGSTGIGLNCTGGATSGSGVVFEAAASGHGLDCQGEGTGSGIRGYAGGTGHGILCLGGVTSGDGAHFEAANAGDGLELVSAGGGIDLNAATTDGLQVDAVEVSGSTDAADRMEAAALGIVTGTVNSANTTPTTTLFACDDITEATADHFIGRLILFYDSGDALFRQMTDITDYAWDATNSEAKFTVTELTEAPSDNDKIVIL
jgi:hypothetical protein